MKNPLPSKIELTGKLTAKGADRVALTLALSKLIASVAVCAFAFAWLLRAL